MRDRRPTECELHSASGHFSQTLNPFLLPNHPVAASVSHESNRLFKFERGILFIPVLRLFVIENCYN